MDGHVVGICLGNTLLCLNGGKDSMANTVWKKFKSCGKNPQIADDAVIDHPEVIEAGDNLRIMKGVVITGHPVRFTIEDNVTIYPYVFMQGDPQYYQFGRNLILYPYTYISGGMFVDIGADTHFAPNCTIYGAGGTRIGNLVAVAANTMIAGVSHSFSRTDIPIVCQPGNAEPITIEDNVYISANVVICGGVTVRTGCVIGGGGVVVEDTVANGFYAGVPVELKYLRHEKFPPSSLMDGVISDT